MSESAKKDVEEEVKKTTIENVDDSASSEDE